MTPKASEPAFPSGYIDPHPPMRLNEEGRIVPAFATSSGLTKRELAAFMAMQGLLSAVYSSKEMLNEFTKSKYSPGEHFGSYVNGCEAVSRNAVAYADALLTELERGREG